ncbi:hypothetical protein [Bifidobacterium thermophilum]|uniref:Uncharacterized protein n=1 Tax=Bifidobacterium thermophilum TaxID=33905 RepID=A0A7X9NRK2_9BIFI|nr:hypothetical protein [Bifidobacterium thermophilum]NME61934.1 hypothetical protein [Bifidobacterium thermophilum]
MSTFGAQWCNGGTECLPVLRWASDAGTLDNRTDGWIQQITSIFSSIPLNVEGMFLSIGNNLWSAAAWLVKRSGGVDVAGKIGPKSNEIAHNLYAALTGDWMLLGLALVAAIVLGMWQAWRHSSPREATRRIGAAVLGVALFLSMGAASTTGSAANRNASPLTPYWTTNLAIKTVSQVGAGAMNSFDKGFDSGAGMLAGQPKGSWMLTSCRRYTANLRNAYLQAKGNDVVLDNLDRMWEETGLRIWIRAQYGAGDTGQTVFCRVLEQRASIPAKEQLAFTRGDATLNGGDDYSNRGQMANLNPDAIIFWPTSLVTKSDTKEKNINEPGAAPERRLDRMQVMWDTCAINTSGDLTIRSGWGFVGDVEGGERGEESTRATGDGHSSYQGLKENCSIALTGTYGGFKNGPLLTHDGDGNMTIITGKGPDKANQRIMNVAEKFDLDESITGTKGGKNDWRALITGRNHGASDRAKRNAENTITNQHGSATVSDLGGALVFSLAGLVNLVIFGLLLGLMRMVATAVAFLIAGLGLPVAFLILAFAPDRGKKAIQGALGQMLGMAAGVTVVGLVAGLDCLITTSFMDMLGVFGEGVGVMPLALCSLIIPPLGLKILQWFCINVWKIGDPMSWGAFGALMAGKKVMKGIGKVAAGVVAGGAALAAGGGLASAIGAAEHGYASGGSPFGMLRAGAAGTRAGEQDAYFRDRRAAKAANDKYGPVPDGRDDADSAAGSNGPKPEPETATDAGDDSGKGAAPDGGKDADDAAGGTDDEAPDETAGGPDGGKDADDAAGGSDDKPDETADDSGEGEAAAGEEETAQADDAEATAETANGAPKPEETGDADHAAETANGTAKQAAAGGGEAKPDRSHRTRPDKQDWAKAYANARTEAAKQAEDEQKAGLLRPGESVEDRAAAIYKERLQNGDIDRMAWEDVPEQSAGRTEPDKADWGKARQDAWQSATQSAEWAEKHHKLPAGMDAREYAQSLYNGMERDGEITRNAWANMNAAHAAPPTGLRLAAQKVSDFATAHPVAARAATLVAANAATVMTGGAAAPAAFAMAAAVNSAASRRGVLHNAGLGLGHAAQAGGAAVATRFSNVAARAEQFSHLADDHKIAGTVAGAAAGLGAGGAAVAAGAAMMGATAGMAAPIAVPLMAGGMAAGAVGANVTRIRQAFAPGGAGRAVLHRADQTLGGFENRVSDAAGSAFNATAQAAHTAAAAATARIDFATALMNEAQATAPMPPVQAAPAPAPAAPRVQPARRAAHAADQALNGFETRVGDAMDNATAAGQRRAAQAAAAAQRLGEQAGTSVHNLAARAAGPSWDPNARQAVDRALGEADMAEADADGDLPDSWTRQPSDADMADMERQHAEDAAHPRKPGNRPDPF